MNIAARFKAAVSAFVGADSSPTRTSTSGHPIDSRREFPQATRHELLKKSRWLRNNMGLVKRMVKGVARYSVGSGLSHIPATGDKEFNKRADAYFEAWASSPGLSDVRGKMSFWKMQDFVAQALIGDGEIFALKVNNPLMVRKPGDPGCPAIQLMETQLCADPLLSSAPRTDGFKEGIKRNEWGATVEYRFLRDRKPGEMDNLAFTDQPAPSVLHVMDNDRVDQLHGITWLHHGENCAIDILDLKALEKAAVKVHSTFAAAIKRKDAGAQQTRSFSGDLKKGQPARPGGPVVSYENFAGGAAMLNLGDGEEFQLLTSNRPQMTWTAFLDYLVRDIAWGLGVSPEFIWAVSGMGGANTRFILEDAKWFFEYVQRILVETFCQPVYAWVIADAIEQGLLEPPSQEFAADFAKCLWQGPAKITVDIGREGNLEIERLRNGLTSWDDIYAARGQSGRKMISKRIDELKEVMDECKEKGVPFELLFEAKTAAPTVDSVDKKLNDVQRQQQDQQDQQDQTQKAA